MKKLAISLILVLSGQVVFAQNEYKTDMKNGPGSTIEINVGSETVQIIGHDKDMILITTDFTAGFVDTPQGRKKEAPERAAGLKPLTASANDNTGIGLVVEKGENFFGVMMISQNARKNSYKFYVPNKAKLSVNDIHAHIESTYSIENHQGEIEVMALNSQIKMSKISGSVVANATNGNIEVVFDKVTPGKPNSFISVNGYVDVTLPKNVAADLEINTVNGEVYTDFDIDVDKDASQALPLAVANMNMFNLEGSINGGGVPIAIQSVNGDIFLRKKE